jgi:hypothetical protein
MKGNDIYFAVFLLSTLYTVCSSYCPSSQLSYKDCSRYYKEVEAALLEDEFNQYQLHEEFFPSSHSAPLYGYALYTNLTDDDGGPYYLCFSWSSSALLAYVSPFALNNLQLQLMEFLFTTAGVHYVTRLTEDNGQCNSTNTWSNTSTESNIYHNTIAQLTLTLNLSMPRKNASVILSDLTSWVSSYEYLEYLACYRLHFSYGKKSQSDPGGTL